MYFFAFIFVFFFSIFVIYSEVTGAKDIAQLSSTQDAVEKSVDKK